MKVNQKVLEEVLQIVRHYQSYALTKQAMRDYNDGKILIIDYNSQLIIIYKKLVRREVIAEMVVDWACWLLTGVKLDSDELKTINI